MSTTETLREPAGPDAAARDSGVREAVRCAHCGLPVPAPSGRSPAEPPAAEGEPLFCCSGCATVYAILRESGLDAYYDMAERRRAPVRASGRGFEEYDHPSFHELYVTKRVDGLSETWFYLEGVHCGSCVWLVERVPLLVSGLARAELDVRRSRLHVAWDAGATPLSAVARTLDTLGYRPHPYRGLRVEAARRSEEREALARIGVAGAIAINAMLAALALYSGWLGGMEPEHQRYFRWVSLLLATPALLGPGRVFFRGAWAALRTRSVHMDLPVALALAAGYARGLVNTVRDAGPIYFDGLTLLVFLLLVGRFLQQRAQRAAADSAELLHALAPSTARVVDGADAREVPVEALLPGMIVEVRAGAGVPADGVVTDGRSTIDLSLLTGESRPRDVEPGSPVYAGSVNRGARLLLRVDRSGEETRIGRILREAERGAARRAPIVALADRMSGWFTVGVLLLAGATLLLWWGRSPSAAVDQAIALLIVTCPCALALATPLAVTAAIGRASKAGILIRSGAALEAVARPGRLLLDKTGTVTEGRVTLLEWTGPGDARPLVLALERHSSHPVATAFEEAWPGLELPEASEAAHTPGRGIEGVVSGRRVVVGSPAFVAERVGGRPPGGGARGEGTPIAVAVDGAIVGLARFGDRIRADARGALHALRARGFEPSLLSGDDPAVVAATGAALDLPVERCRGGAAPEEKLRAVEEATARGPVIMVGDGVNDAAAIARATVGVGVSGGAEACLATADVFLARPGLSPLVALVDGARRTLGVIRRNILWSVAYNVAGASLAMLGYINPLVAAVLMPLSSVTVVLSSWKSRTFEAAP